MREKRPQILCVGHEPDLLALRCAILDQAGYASVSAKVEEAEALLKREKFDLVIVSARVSEQEIRRLRSLTPDIPVVLLDGVTFPRDLLKHVSDLMASRAAGVSTSDA
jgi:DNA-binding response OmpR family regulator